MTTDALSRTDRTGRWVPFAPIALILVPAVAGSLRLLELSGGPRFLPANLGPGAFQFSRGLRRRHPKWHRQSGMVVVPLGLAVAFSAMWLTVFHAGQPGTLFYVVRLTFGLGMAVCMAQGFAVIRHGDVARHRAWMTRAYALAVGPGWAIALAVAEYFIRRRGLLGPGLAGPCLASRTTAEARPS